MKILIGKSSWPKSAPKPGKEVSIASAIGGTIDDAADGYDGELERSKKQSDKAAELLGQLIQTLHENGVLRNEQVASMLGYSYVVE